MGANNKQETEFWRECPKCKEKLYYADKFRLKTALEKGKQCQRCAAMENSKKGAEASKRAKQIRDANRPTKISKQQVITPWKRSCPKCENAIYYTSERAFRGATKCQKLCRSCSKKEQCKNPTEKQQAQWKTWGKTATQNRKDARVQRFDGSSLERQCPSCENTIIYSDITHRWNAEQAGSLCFSCARKELWNDPNHAYNQPAFGKKIGQTVSQRHKTDKDFHESSLIGLAKGRGTSENSVSELEITEILKSTLNAHGFLHSTERSQPFVGPYVPDYINFTTKTIVEINGDYWHANPLKWNKNDLIEGLGVLASKAWTRDETRRAFFEQHGYRIIEIWECDIKRLKRKPNKLIDWIVLNLM